MSGAHPRDALRRALQQRAVMTIARFRVLYEQALSDLFTSVLALCAKPGLVQVGVIAVEGTKISADASMHANRTYEQIAREILAEAAAADAADDARF